MHKLKVFLNFRKKVVLPQTIGLIVVALFQWEVG